MAETILERITYSVFSMKKLPPPRNPGASVITRLGPLLDIADKYAGGDHSNPHPLVYGDFSQADPASIGIALLIANWTRAAHKRKPNYAGAAKSQADYLLKSALRLSDGAISHRHDAAQIWCVQFNLWRQSLHFLFLRSDSMYMIPPFLAYYGVVTGDIKFVREAYTQTRLYRKHLLGNQGMWKHIDTIDQGYWSTGVFALRLRNLSGYRNDLSLAQVTVGQQLVFFVCMQL
jgi:hypothetical protein